MHSLNLLVTDRSPETAERINSLLRNSGIKIHVIHVQSSTEVKRALDRDEPVLILYADADESDAPLSEINDLAASSSVPLALLTPLKEPEALAEALSETACYVINSDNEQLLISAVERLVRAREHERAHLRREQELDELQQRYNLVLDTSREAIAYIHEGLHVYTNRAYREALDVSDESEIAGISLLEMLDAGDTDLKALFRGLSKGNYPSDPLDVMVKRPDGSTFDARLTFSPSRFDGEDCIQMMVQRSDAAEQLAAELERLRLIDPVTRLMNRKAFSDVLEECIDEEPVENSVAVLYIEPDGFNELRDELDADSADVFIADLGAVIKGCLRESDQPARVSDYGFAVLARREDGSRYEALAEKILETYRSHVVDIGDRALSATCSIGVAGIGRASRNPMDVMTHARKAHSEAAADGDSVVVYRPQLTAVSSPDDDQEWIDRIRFAIHNDDFYSVQQSIVDLDGEGEHLVENMTYLREETGDHPPAEFMDIADRHDLAGAIDRHVIPGLLKSFVESEEPQIVTISNNSVLDYGFPGWLADQIRASCVEGGRVVLQIPASAALSNLKPAQRLIKELQPLGCQLAISSFDASGRCLQLLDHLDVAYVKLSPEMTEDLTTSSSNREAVQKVVDAAENSEVLVIADEVSNTSALAALWQCGVKLIAGTFLKEQSQVLAQ